MEDGAKLESSIPRGLSYCCWQLQTLCGPQFFRVAKSGKTGVFVEYNKNGNKDIQNTIPIFTLLASTAIILMYRVAIKVSKCSCVSPWPVRDWQQASQGPSQPQGRDRPRNRTAQNDPNQEAGNPGYLCTIGPPAVSSLSFHPSSAALACSSVVSRRDAVPVPRHSHDARGMRIGHRRQLLHENVSASSELHCPGSQISKCGTWTSGISTTWKLA